MRILFLILFFLTVFATAEELPDHDITLFELKSGRLSSPVVVAGRLGYDNQPHFSADSKTVFFTRMEDGNADIWSWSKGVGEKRYAATSLGEYSPTIMPTGGLLSTVRVEEDGTQRLWSLSPEGSFKVLFDTIKPVGYHAWSGSNVGFFVLGEPPQLMVAKLGDKEGKFVVENIGRCLQPVPGKDAVSFTVEHRGFHFLGIYDFEQGEAKFGRGLPRGTQDYVWLDSENILTSNQTMLLASPWDGGEAWTQYYTPEPLQGISRLAISPDRTKLAVVHLKRGWFL